MFYAFNILIFQQSVLDKLINRQITIKKDKGKKGKKEEGEDDDIVVEGAEDENEEEDDSKPRVKETVHVIFFMKKLNFLGRKT